MRRIDDSPMQTNSGSASRRRLPILITVSLLLVLSAGFLMLRPSMVAHGQGSSCSPMPVCPTDPGPRPLPAAAGTFYPALNANQNAITTRLTQIFTEVNFVAGGPLVKTVGLGPRFNSNSCSSCHAYPAVGGSSSPSNPLFGIYQLMGATNTMPYFITTNGPTMVARFPYSLTDLSVPDGGVHQMFTISNRTDAPGCTTMVQPNFTQAQADNDIIFRQVTPTYGVGLMELIQESAIVANMNSNLTLKASLGITGHPNYADDGTIGRFGWKAQHKSMVTFSGEAYTVEEGVSDEAFPSENDESIASCLPPFPVAPGTNKTKGVSG